MPSFEVGDQTYIDISIIKVKVCYPINSRNCTICAIQKILRIIADEEDVNVVINIAFILKVHIRQYLTSSNIKLIS